MKFQSGEDDSAGHKLPQCRCMMEADVVIRPALGGVGSAAFSERRRSIEAGRAAMLQALPALRKALER